MKPVIVSTKHYVQIAAFAISSGIRSAIPLIEAKEVVVSSAVDIVEGSVVKAIYIEAWISGVTAEKTAITAVLKLPGGGTVVPTFTEMQSLNDYSNKKNIFEAHQGIAPTGGNTVPFYRGWIKIPKGKQRFGLGDKLQLVVAAVSTNVNLCIMATYKDYH